MVTVDVLQRTLERERRARQLAEELLEHKSLELFEANRDLQALADELREQNHRMQSILNAAAEGIISINHEGRIESLNPAAEQIFGTQGTEAVGCDLGEFVRPNFDEQVDSILGELLKRTAEQETITPLSLTGRRVDGASFPMELSLSEVTVGERRMYTGIVRDISQRIQLEAQLTHALKMESVGQLAAGVAHEINSPIQYVGDNLTFLKQAFVGWSKLLEKYQQLEKRCSDDGEYEAELIRIRETILDEDIDFVRQEMPGAIEQAIEGTQRVAKIVRAMREFSHPGGKEAQEIDLNEAIKNTAVVARNEWKYHANLELDLDPSLPLVSCLANEMSQVFLNLVINAAHAIEEKVGGTADKGTIRVSTRRENEHVIVRISDTGSGIPSEIQSRIFDPFFTTKPVGKGTGQGLGFVYSIIVEQHDGHVDFETGPESGTTFIIRIPLVANHH